MEYKAWEVLKMYQEGKLKGKYITDKNGNCDISDTIRYFHLETLIKFEPYTIVDSDV